MQKKQIGIIIAIIGIALIIISQSVRFTTIEYHNTGEWLGQKNMSVGGYAEDTAKKNGMLYLGIGLLIGGGIIFALGLNKNANTL